jgi:cyclophilin family peptidyl-prolyl cis-trans isomerase
MSTVRLTPGMTLRTHVISDSNCASTSLSTAAKVKPRGVPRQSRGFTSLKLRMRFTVTGTPIRRLFAVAGLLAAASMPLPVTSNTLLRMQTDLGGIDIELFDTQAPLTVGNFLNYVNRGDYDGTFIHRSVPGFVVQGGGYIFNPDNGAFFGSGTTHIPVDPPIVNEPDPVNRPNARGTLAMAKTSDPDSATSEWFFNLADNPTLDDPNNSGGFAVFGKVLGDGMVVIDAIAAQLRCINIAPFPFLCGSFPEVPFIGYDGSSAIQPENLAIVNNIGYDNDGDGAIDSLEDAAPNNGDGNNDGTQDSTQTNVASFPGSAGEYVVIEAPAAASIRSLDILGATFALANPPDPPRLFDVLDFSNGYAGFDLTGIAPGGAVSVTETLAAGGSADTYYVFGPTADNTVPHWYEFRYDGTTGAEIIGNEIILHFVDGGRGDADLDNANGVITASPGGSAICGDADGDCVPDTVEDAAPNGGDGNKDGIADSVQGNVVSFPNAINGRYVTLVTDPTLLFISVADQTLVLFANSSKVIEGLNFPYSLFGFSLINPNNAAVRAATVEVILPEGESATTYYKYGPTPDNPAAHWYEFLYDGETGAEISGNVVTLHLVDGKRGDSDLAANSAIVDPGGPAQQADISGASGGGGGCSLIGQARNPEQTGAWWLLFTLVILLRLRPAISSRL